MKEVSVLNQTNRRHTRIEFLSHRLYKCSQPSSAGFRTEFYNRGAVDGNNPASILSSLTEGVCQ